MTSLLRTPHLGLLLALYTAQGLPYGFFTLALPALMREAGWSLTAIGFLHMLAAPWALKFLWAPWVDHHGQRRTWLLAMQLTSCVLALLMAGLGLQTGSLALFALVLAFNLAAATQDVATDGLAIRLLDARQLGLANGIQVGAYRLGMVLGGGLLLWLLARTSWSTAFLAMAAMLALLTLPVWRLREPAAILGTEPAAPAVAAAAPHPQRLTWLWVRRALRPGLLPLLGLIFLFRFGDQMASGIITPFLSDQGVDKATLALMKGAVGSGTSLAGAALGAWLLLRVGRRAALLGSGLGQVGAFALYLMAALGHGGMPLLWVATVVEGVIGTIALVALFSLMMDASDPAHAGTDYTLLGAVGVSLGSMGGIAGGMVGDAFGYAPAFVAGSVVSVVGVLALVRWVDRHPLHPRVARAWR